MINKIEFGQCLQKLLNILDVSGIKLAKAINVDASLVSKWKNGKRVISSKSNYIELISDYITKNIKKDYQKEELIEFINSLDISIPIKDPCNLKRHIYKTLLITNQISTQKHFKTNYKVPSSKPHFSPNANVNSHIYENTKISHNTTELSTTYNREQTFELIVGHRNVIQAGINLLKSALANPCCINDPIIITFFTELDSFCSFEETYLEWNKVLLEVLNRGWRVITLIRLNENIHRNLKIIKEIEMCILTGTYYPYYLNKYNLLDIPCEYIIVPTIGALSCVGSQDINKFNSAFLIKDRQSTEIQKQHINLFLKRSSPLSNDCGPITNLEESTKSTFLEEKNGNRYALHHSLPVLTIPLNLYKKYLFYNPNKIPDKEIPKILSLHKKRIDAFIKQIKHYKYYDICSKKSIMDMVEKSQFTSVKVKSSDILMYLENVIYMLENYDNYYIALFNDFESDDNPKTSWIIKDSYNVLLQNSNIYKNNNYYATYYENHISTIISEPTIVNAFKHYFMDLWSEIPPIDKEKKSVVFWLKNQIKAIVKT